ncbi:hypothetical protein [Thalassospira sp.]|uniref:hypothetical protein n=1 Tax=Thalassospira sp. TaxID=1912094 RepID=UPI0027340E52|nr:hypothetical protein [Thalassospira sp.]MDP2700267.1 hypothetical protein [Thalassospira sp.]
MTPTKKIWPGGMPNAPMVLKHKHTALLTVGPPLRAIAGDRWGVEMAQAQSAAKLISARIADRSAPHLSGPALPSFILCQIADS